MFKFKKVEADPELVELGIHCDNPRFDYEKMADDLNGMIKKNSSDEFYNTLRIIGEDDLFAFCYFVLNLPVNHPFLMARIYEVQDCHNKTIDLWAREHWKSTILTFALTIWTMAREPESRQAIFAHTRAIAKSFLRLIRIELESNEILKMCWPEVFYENPEKESKKWSEEEGLINKRKQRSKEASLEAWGLIDSLPVSKHFTHRIYDDIVTDKNVSTPGQQKKALDAYHQSVHLGARGGQDRVIGTRYSSADVYSHIMKEPKRKARVYPAEVDEQGKAKFQGKPVLITREELDEKYEKLSEFNYSSQMLQDPVAKSEQKFQLDWVRYYKNLPYLNLYMVVDPAGKKAAGNDYTVINVIGTDSLRNYFLVDMVRDKLNLGERYIAVRDKVQEWDIKNPVGYESYGMQADIEYIKERQEAEGCYFHIEPLGGITSKYDRIKKLIPLFSRGRFFLPYALPYTDTNDKFHELITEFLSEEYEKFPFSAHDDILDCMARIMEAKMNVTFPTRSGVVEQNTKRRFDPLASEEGTGRTWMAE